MGIAIWAGYPRSYTAGRPRPVQFIVVHYTAGSEGPGAAEAGAAYDKRRLDGTSTHVFADSDTVVREVWDQDQAHAALQHGNWIGLQLELCGTAQTREQWLDATSLATLRLAAVQCAEWCRAHDIPVRRLTVAETRAAWYAPAGQRPKGFVGHVDVTQAYPEDGGTHTDPGPAFPWDVFLQFVNEELGSSQPPAEEEMSVKLIAPDAGYAKGGVLKVYPTPLGMALEPLDGELGPAVALWGQEVHVQNARLFGTPIEELRAEWERLAKLGAGPTTVTVTPGPMTLTGTITPKA